MKILENINSPEDVKHLTDTELDELALELREFIVQNVSKTGGHLASGLGAVELTLALHRVYDSSRDRIVFDVGHQSYAHKIITGRREKFDTLRQLGGISGFPKPTESIHDAFVAGHASTSVSVALGMARARSLSGGDYAVCAVIGDGALTGGTAYEALCDAGDSGEPLVVVLNDNEMSITRNVGGLAHMLARMRSRPKYFSFKKAYRRVLNATAPGRKIYKRLHKIKTNIKTQIYNCSMFEALGFTYLGPVDGHDIKQLTFLLQWARELNCPVLVHVLTKKGKGYKPAEERPELHHGVGTFDPAVGVLPDSGKRDFSAVFGEKLSALAREDGRICAITAAMTSGTGLTGFAKEFPERFFDVGIAEEHAVAMAGGLAKQGMIPVPVIYSTFLQRAYDMLMEEVSMLSLHVVFGVDRAGLVGADGETHQGVFDVDYLMSVPNMRVLCPASFAELEDMLEYAVKKSDCPVAVRYPRGGEGAYRAAWSGETFDLLRSGGDITLIGYGVMINELLSAAELLKRHGISAQVIKLNCLDDAGLAAVINAVGAVGAAGVAVVEDCIDHGCVGERLAAMCFSLPNRPKFVKKINLGGDFIPHGSVEELRRIYGIDADGICAACEEALNGEAET